MKRLLTVIACIFLGAGPALASYDSPEGGGFWGPALRSKPFKQDRYIPLIGGRVSLAGVRPELAQKAAEIVSQCGSRVISGHRHSLVAGTRRLSLHASGKAVDMAGNPSCIYAMLRDWPGGVSIDYGRVRHVHFSYDPEGGREMGARFAHHGHHRHYARRHRHIG